MACRECGEFGVDTMMSLGAIADEVNGRVDGEPDFIVDSLKSMETADSRSLTYFNGRAHRHRPQTKAGAILVKAEHAALFSMHRIIVGDPHLAYARVSRLFARADRQAPGISRNAVVAKTARLGASVSIGHFSVVGHDAVIGDGARIGGGVHVGREVTIGENTVIEERAVIMDSCVIGGQCMISAGAVIGSCGFGYAQDGAKWERIEQLGRVVIGERVDVGANTTIDRGALDDTVIADGVKMDNLIQIAHNVKIGEDTAIAGCVGIAGSTRIGRRCRIGGRAAILGHLEIADDVDILANTLVSASIREPGEYASMIPAQPARIWRKNLAVLRRLGTAGRKFLNQIKPDEGEIEDGFSRTHDATAGENDG